MREFIEQELEDYILDEIDYIKRENDVCGFDKGRYADLLSLEILKDSTQEKNKIVDEIMGDDELYQVITETLHYYVYHREGEVRDDD